MLKSVPPSLSNDSGHVPCKFLRQVGAELLFSQDGRVHRTEAAAEWFGGKKSAPVFQAEAGLPLYLSTSSPRT